MLSGWSSRGASICAAFDFLDAFGVLLIRGDFVTRLEFLKTGDDGEPRALPLLVRILSSSSSAGGGVWSRVVLMNVWWLGVSKALSPLVWGRALTG
jgi:hypothetical protein